MNMKFPFQLAVALICISPLVADAQITIFGSPTGYQTDNKDWQTETANDIDGNGLGTDGFIFFGDFLAAAPPFGNTNPTEDQNGNIIGSNTMAATNRNNVTADTLFTVSAPSYVTVASTGADSSNVGQFAYESIDNPVTLDGTDEIAGNLLVTGTGESVLEFTISGLAAGTTVRVGVLGAVLNDDNRARFDAPEIGLSDGTNSVSVTGLPNLSDGTAGASLGWVFFDITSDGDYTISVPPDMAAIDPDVTGLGGVTFDSISGTPTVCGDVNLDGSVSFLDIQPFIAILSAGGFQAEADCDGNGAVNFLDIQGFIAALSGP